MVVWALVQVVKAVRDQNRNQKLIKWGIGNKMDISDVLD